MAMGMTAAGQYVMTAWLFQSLLRRVATRSIRSRSARAATRLCRDWKSQAVMTYCPAAVIPMAIVCTGLLEPTPAGNEGANRERNDRPTSANVAWMTTQRATTAEHTAPGRRSSLRSVGLG